MPSQNLNASSRKNDEEQSKVQEMHNILIQNKKITKDLEIKENNNPDNLQQQSSLKNNTKRTLKFVYGSQNKQTQFSSKDKNLFHSTINDSLELNETHQNQTKYEKINIIDKDNYLYKEIEVECEIEEDPSFLEGSENYVKNLISKIQAQYKDPELVHIKIIRRQKQIASTNYQPKAGQWFETQLQKEQIVKKEYYTVKPIKSNHHVKCCSFVNTSDIPFIDDEIDLNKLNNSNEKLSQNNNQGNKYLNF
jgi:hypothetical protein